MWNTARTTRELPLVNIEQASGICSVRPIRVNPKKAVTFGSLTSGSPMSVLSQRSCRGRPNRRTARARPGCDERGRSLTLPASSEGDTVSIRLDMSNSEDTG